MNTILSTESRLAKGVGTILGHAKTSGVTFLGRRIVATRLRQHSEHSPEGRRDVDDASLGHEIQGDRDDSRGDAAEIKKNKSIKRATTTQTTTDGPSVYDKERTRGCDDVALATTDGGDDNKQCITSGYHIEIAAGETNMKIIFESTAHADLQVVVRGKEGQQTFTLPASSERKLEDETTKPTLLIAVKAEKVGTKEKEEGSSVALTEEEHAEEQKGEQDKDQMEEQHEEHEKEQLMI